MPKHTPDKDAKPEPKAKGVTQDDQAMRFKALAKDEGLDTPEAHERFKGSLFTIAKSKPKGRLA